MSEDPRRQLGAFLQNKRRAMPGGAPRKPGMRREEVAALVHISPEYYRRIEQGRFLPSAPVLRAVGDVLHLTVDERQYCLDLAHAAQPLPRRPEAEPPVVEGVERLQAVVDHLRDAPALVVGAWTTILACNESAARLFAGGKGDASRLVGRSVAELVFTDAGAMRLFPELGRVQADVVAILRAGSATWPDPDRGEQLVHRLSTASATFAQVWQAHQVRQPHLSATVLLDVPGLGVVTASQVVLLSPKNDQARVLAFLRSEPRELDGTIPA